MGADVKYELRKYKELETYNGLAYTFTLWVDGKPACTVENRGDGGMTWVDWSPSGAVDRWSTEGSRLAPQVLAYVEQLPPDRDYGKLDLESWLAVIADEFVQDRKLKRLCRTRTVYRKSDTSPGSWIVSTRPYSTEFARKLRTEDSKVEIYNER